MAGYIGSKAVNLSTTGADINGDANIDGDLSFRDNDKAIFGAGSDLQIYHDGTRNYIDSDTTELRLQTSELRMVNSANTEIGLKAVEDGAVTLYYDANPKLATTSTGVDITGTLTSDGLTVDGDGRINQTSGNASTLTFTSNGQASRYSRIKVDTDRSLILTAGVGAVNETPDIKLQTGTATGEKDRILIDGATGDISFYEDTGTTAKFFWDASAERLGLGTTSPSSNIDIEDAAEVKIDLNSTAGRIYRLRSTTDSKFIIRDSSAAADRLSIDSSGNVGIGTSSPYSLATIQGSSSGQNVLHLSNSAGTSDGGAENGLRVTCNGNSNWANLNIQAYQTLFTQNNSEKMRIDSSGNLLVGTTSASGSGDGIVLSANDQVIATRNGAPPLWLNRRSSDGNIVLFNKDGSTVGSIGTDNGGDLFIGNDDTGFLFGGGSDAILPWNPSGPAPRDNTIDLGNASHRFDDIYATNGTIQTSDRNEKQDIAELSDAEQRVAVAAKGLMRKFRWKDAVAEKGDEARTHFGIIAQDLQAAFAAEGLDAGDYAMFISSTWTDEETGEERTRMGVRYSELLAFIIGAL